MPVQLESCFKFLIILADQFRSRCCEKDEYEDEHKEEEINDDIQSQDVLVPLL